MGQADEQCRHVRAQGRVQGVGFRESCLRYARQHGITGWVRNRSDGSVEAQLQGSPEALDAMCKWLSHGVPGARVDGLEVLPSRGAFERLDSFDRLPTL
jgi:acylphosphatase